MIKLGSRIHDQISGLIGIATAKIEYLNGCTQYYLEPPAKDMKQGEGYYTDEVNLLTVTGGLVVPQHSGIHKFDLGQEVKDRVTGFRGVAVSRLTSINLCVQYGVRPKVDKKDKKIENASYVDDQQLDLVGNGVMVKKTHTGAHRHSDAPA